MRHGQEGWGGSRQALLCGKQSGRYAAISPGLVKRLQGLAASFPSPLHCSSFQLCRQVLSQGRLPSRQPYPALLPPIHCSLPACRWHPALPLVSDPLSLGIALQMTVHAVIWFSSEPADFLHTQKQPLFCNAQEKFRPRSRSQNGEDASSVFFFT